jgi:hypothetical protein
MFIYHYLEGIGMILNEQLAQRIRNVLVKEQGLEEKIMFGGIGFLLHGNMVCGIHKEYMIVRVGPGKYQEALGQPNTKVFDMTGRTMSGWVMVAPEGYADDTQLSAWLQKGIDFVSELPAKK